MGSKIINTCNGETISSDGVDLLQVVSIGEPSYKCKVKISNELYSDVDVHIQFGEKKLPAEKGREYIMSIGDIVEFEESSHTFQNTTSIMLTKIIDLGTVRKARLSCRDNNNSIFAKN